MFPPQNHHQHNPAQGPIRWRLLIGFYLAFMPLYLLGPDGHNAAHAALR
jgi:hypothetical protein